MKAILFILTFTMLTSITMEAQKQKRRTKNYYLTDVKSAKEIAQLDNKLEKIANLFIGHFTSQSQTGENSALDQELIGRRIWQQRSGETWIYLGWFKADFIERPLYTSICKFSRVSPDTILMESFDYPDHEKYMEEWMNKEPFQDLEPGDLMKQGADCGVYFVKNKDGDNKFTMLPKGLCHQPLNSTIEYSMLGGIAEPEALTTSNKLYGKDENLVIETNSKFVRSDKNKPKY